MFLSQVTNISFWFFFSTWSNGVHSWWWPVWDIFFVSNIFFLFQIFFSMWSNGVHSSWWPVGDLGQCSHNLPPHCWLTGTLSEITNRHEPTNTKHAKTIHTHTNKHKNYTNTQCKRDNNDSRLLTDWLRANSNGQTKKDVWESFCSKLLPFWSPPKILGISQNVGDLKTALHYFRLIAWQITRGNACFAPVYCSESKS